MTTPLRRLSCLMALALLWPINAFAQQTEATTPARGARAGGRMSMAERANLPAPQGFSVVLVLGELQGAAASDTVPAAARKALADMKDFLPYKSYKLLDTQWTLCCGRSGIVTRLRGPEEQDYDLELDPSPSDTSGKWNVRFTLRDPISNAARSDVPLADRNASITTQRAELEAKLRTLKERYNETHPEVQALKKQLSELQSEQERIRAEENAKRYRLMASSGRSRAMIDTSFTMDIGETVVVGTSRLKGDKALIALLTAVPTTKTTAR